MCMFMCSCVRSPPWIHVMRDRWGFLSPHMVLYLLPYFFRPFERRTPVISFLLGGLFSFSKYMSIFAQDHYDFPQVCDFRTYTAWIGYCSSKSNILCSSGHFSNGSFARQVLMAWNGRFSIGAFRLISCVEWEQIGVTGPLLTSQVAVSPT